MKEIPWYSGKKENKERKKERERVCAFIYAREIVVMYRGVLSRPGEIKEIHESNKTRKSCACTCKQTNERMNGFARLEVRDDDLRGTSCRPRRFGCVVLVQLRWCNRWAISESTVLYCTQPWGGDIGENGMIS